MKRRDFLQISATGTLALGIPGSLGIATTTSPLYPLAQPALLDLPGHAALVRRIGRTYRELCPEEDAPDVLAEAIRAGAASSADGPLLLDEIALLVRLDFAQDRIVQVGGWILSRTEARQCALFSILHA